MWAVGGGGSDGDRCRGVGRRYVDVFPTVAHPHEPPSVSCRQVHNAWRYDGEITTQVLIILGRLGVRVAITTNNKPGVDSAIESYAVSVFELAGSTSCQ